MTSFSVNRITTETDIIAGELLNGRQAMNLKIDDVAQQLGINRIYLDALEQGNLNQLPAGLYGRNYLREYAEFLGVNSSELLGIYDNYMSADEPEIGGRIFAGQRADTGYALTISKVARNTLIVVAVTFCFIYLGFYLKQLTAPPALSVISPADNTITDEHAITITGTAEAETEITINGKSVLSDPQGQFSREVHLKDGINKITVLARKKYGQENVIVRQVLVKDERTN